MEGPEDRTAAANDAAPPAMGRRPQRDFTTGPIGKTLFLFSLPVLGTNILQSLNGSANAIWVSHVLGEAALTATSNANQILFLLLGASFGLTMASNILIGQALGAKDTHTVRKVVGTSTTFFVVVSLIIGALGAALTAPILDAMGTPAEARRDAIIYLRVIFSAIPFMFFFTYVMMAMRGVGDSRTPFYFSLLSVALGIVLNPLMIIGFGPIPGFGIAGSAASTLVSQTITLAAMLVYLYRRRSILVLRPSEFRLLIPDMSIVGSLVAKGVPMGFQMVVVSLAAVTMMGLVNRYGIEVSAAYGAAAQVWTYVQMPAMALGAAVSSMAAQNVGAGRMDRVEQIARSGTAYALLATAIPVVLIYIADPYVLQAFLPATSPALPIAVHINAYVLWSFLFFGMAFIFSGVMRATGAVWPPLVAMVISLWGVRIPFANLMEPWLGQDAVWASFPVGSLSTLILAAAYYRWGGWRKSRLGPTTMPATDEPDTGFGQPMIAEAEVIAEAASRAQEVERRREAS